MQHRLTPATDGYRRGAFMTAVAMTVALTACGSGAQTSAAPPRPHAHEGPTVVLEAQNFAPADLVIDAGSTVTWTWAGGVAHDVAGDRFASAVQRDGAFHHTFDQVGTYNYRCNLHPRMTGSVTVSA